MLHQKTLEQMRLLVAELDPDDGTPDRRRRREERRHHRSSARARRLCGQAARALTLALPTASDPQLRSLLVVEVVPAPDLRRLEARIAAPPGQPLEGLEQRLGLSRTWLREEVAHAIHRKKAPDLRIVLVPCQEGSP
jgi:ribosome-binding factor A